MDIDKIQRAFDLCGDVRDLYISLEQCLAEQCQSYMFSVMFLTMGDDDIFVDHSNILDYQKLKGLKISLFEQRALRRLYAGVDGIHLSEYGKTIIPVGPEALTCPAAMLLQHRNRAIGFLILHDAVDLGDPAIEAFKAIARCLGPAVTRLKVEEYQASEKRRESRKIDGLTNLIRNWEALEPGRYYQVFMGWMMDQFRAEVGSLVRIDGKRRMEPLAGMGLTQKHLDELCRTKPVNFVDFLRSNSRGRLILENDLEHDFQIRKINPGIHSLLTFPVQDMEDTLDRLYAILVNPNPALREEEVGLEQSGLEFVYDIISLICHLRSELNQTTVHPILRRQKKIFENLLM